MNSRVSFHLFVVNLKSITGMLYRKRVVYIRFKLCSIEWGLTLCTVELYTNWAWYILCHLSRFYFTGCQSFLCWSCERYRHFSDVQLYHNSKTYSPRCRGELSLCSSFLFRSSFFYVQRIETFVTKTRWLHIYYTSWRIGCIITVLTRRFWF